jgi:hypothetical protein
MDKILNLNCTKEELQTILDAFVYAQHTVYYNSIVFDDDFTDYNNCSSIVIHKIKELLNESEG